MGILLLAWYKLLINNQQMLSCFQKIMKTIKHLCGYKWIRYNL